MPQCNSLKDRPIVKRPTAHKGVTVKLSDTETEVADKMISFNVSMSCSQNAQ